MNKKAISPVIATVLLIAIVIILILLVYLWGKGFIGEAIEKKGMPVEQACGEVDLDLNYVGSDLQITNRGNIPVYKFELRKKSGSSIDVEKEEGGLQVGRTILIESVGGYDEIEVVPIILGEGETSKKAYTCEEDSFVV